MLRFNRRASGGEILHPYAARKSGKRWIVKLYLPFPQTFDEMQERDFIALPIATAAGVRFRSKRHGNVRSEQHRSLRTPQCQPLQAGRDPI